ncbi:hypothetical protein J5U18_00730 [Sphingobacteriaceae bacterium WQ 2009]|uniref:CarboxypepD_reg-like domain-containing protein n=1 Tax=Rhinopithecimicrobium faecis TaxID=2820698 RepID=A0A8T4HBD2_9SPHI|nr:hypothetical protein [Sphingobacteriaceae bacterium WQ 2009]
MVQRIGFNTYVIVCLLFLSSLGIGVAQAQMIQQVSGVVLEKGVSNRLVDVNITNLRTKHQVISNNFGVFNVAASVGDSLSFTKIGYGTVKTVLYSLQDFVIEMQAGIQLETVNVDRLSKEAELRSYMKDYERKGIYNNGNNNFRSYVSSPATALYNLFGREAKNAKRFSRMMDKELEETKVDRVFNKTLVTQHTGLEGDQLQSFMDIYRPSFHMVNSWGQYDVLNYIKSNFELYEKNGRPKSDRLPKIEVPIQER